MSRDFWMGVMAIPAAVCSVLLIGMVFLVFVYAWSKTGEQNWKVRPVNVNIAASIVAVARKVRYIRFPGGAVMLVRTANADARRDDEFFKLITGIQHDIATRVDAAGRGE